MSFNISRTIIYILTTLAFVFMFFFAGTSHANACVVDQAIIRTSAYSGYRVDLSNVSGWYDGDNVPFVYLDIETTGCIEEGQLKIVVAGLRGTSGDAGNNGSLVVDSSHIVNTNDIESNGNFTFVLRPTENVCYIHNKPDCLILFFIKKNDDSIIRIMGNIASRMTLEEAGSFVNTVTLGELPINSQPSSATGNDCYGSSIGTSVGYYFQQATFSCPGAQWSFDFGGVYKDYSSSVLSSFLFGSIDEKIHQYNTQILGLNLDFPEWSLGNFFRFRAAFPSFLFECDGIVCGSSFSEGPWTSLGILPLGQAHPDDAGAVPVSGLPENYELEYAPLAPLPFPGLDGGGTPNLETYLQGIFRMLLIVAVVLSVIMIVIAGFQYVASSANPQGKGEARKRLSGALIGLVLALGSWLLLDTVNPNFASNLSITIPKVSLAGDADVQPSSFTGGITAFSIQQDVSSLQLECPLSGGSSAVPQIVASFEGKVTYRYGGKGGPLPAGQSFTASPGEMSGGPYMCTDESGNQTACRNFCPTNSLCLDCSGFVNHVLRCAGLSYVDGGTSSMVNDQQAIAVNMGTLNGSGTSLSVNDENYNLQPGDLLVYNGHVVIYIGDGNVAESRGALSDFQTANSNIQIRSLFSHPNKNSFTHLLKAF